MNGPPPPLRSAPPRAVLFDLDDTLFDHRACARHALRALCERHPCLAARPFAEVERDYHHYLEELHVRVVAGELSPEASRRERFRRLFARTGADEDSRAHEAAAFFHCTYLGVYQPVPGAAALLRAVRGRGARVGIVTNNVTAEQTRKLSRCGLEDLIDTMVVSEEAGIAKPDPEIFRLALRRLGCRADEAVMVGDAWLTDVLGARAAGIRAVWLNRLGAPCPDPAAAAELPALEPLEAALRTIFG